MKTSPRFAKERAALARHRIFVFKEEAKVIPAPGRSINPLFLKAHRYEFTQILLTQPN